MRYSHRSGAVAPLLGDRYLRLGTPRPIRELEIGWELEALGIPTPAHIGAAVYPSGIWYRGDLVTRYVPGSRDLAAVLFPGRTLEARPGDSAAPDRRAAPERGKGASREGGPASTLARPAAMTATGRLFRQLHDAGVSHPDLNLKNILLTGPPESPRALVLDLDGARLHRSTVHETGLIGDRGRRRMIERFWRSARKWQRATGAVLEPDLEAAFRAGYETGPETDPGAERETGPDGGAGAGGVG